MPRTPMAPARLAGQSRKSQRQGRLASSTAPADATLAEECRRIDTRAVGVVGIRRCCNETSSNMPRHDHRLPGTRAGVEKNSNAGNWSTTCNGRRTWSSARQDPRLGILGWGLACQLRKLGRIRRNVARGRRRCWAGASAKRQPPWSAPGISNSFHFLHEQIGLAYSITSSFFCRSCLGESECSAPCAHFAPRVRVAQSGVKRGRVERAGRQSIKAMASSCLAAGDRIG